MASRTSAIAAPLTMERGPSKTPWRAVAALLCGILLIVLIVGSLCSPLAKQYLRPVLSQHSFPQLIRMYQHRLVHVSGFGLPAALLFAICSIRWQLAASALFLILIAIGMEYIQHWIYRGPLEWWDIRDDVGGILIGALVAFVWRLGTKRDGRWLTR